MKEPLGRFEVAQAFQSHWQLNRCQDAAHADCIANPNEGTWYEATDMAEAPCAGKMREHRISHRTAALEIVRSIRTIPTQLRWEAGSSVQERCSLCPRGPRRPVTSTSQQLALRTKTAAQLVAQRQLWAHTAKKRRSEYWAQMRGRKASDTTLEKRRQFTKLREEQAVENMKCLATQAQSTEHMKRGAASEDEASDETRMPNS